MRKMLRAGSAFFLFILWAIPAFGHHAMEYIEMESYHTARKGEFVFHLHFDYMVDDQNNPRLDHWEYTPGLSYGITDRLMADVHTHFAGFGIDHLAEGKRPDFGPGAPSPFFEAVAFSLQYRLTENFPIDIAVAALYEAPLSRSRELLEGERVYEGILILSRTLANHVSICANLKYGKDGGETVKEWALGVKTPLTADPHGIAAGVEFLGDFDGHLSLLGGVYFPLGAENILFKTGVEVGNHPAGLRVNATLMYRF